MPLREDMLVPPPNRLPALDGLSVHLLGIRGRGMTPVALAARYLGADVDGCDRLPALAHDALARAGIRVADGHDVAHVRERSLVVTTFAPPHAPEVEAARAAGRLHHRTDLLGAIVAGRSTVAVTGTHGKGTVAALVGCAAARLGLDPLIVLGVAARPLDGPFRGGAGPAVVEADDADGTISRIPATVSVVTNSWADHPMLGRSRAEVLGDIARHVAGVPVDGRVVVGRAQNVAPVVAAARAPVWMLGRDLEVETVSIDHDGRTLLFHDPDGSHVTGRVRIHGGNIADNAALAFAALRALGIGSSDAAAALEALEGLDRRLEPVGEASGVRVFDDYGKHPEAVAATLAAARELGPRRLHVVYEPNLHADVLRFRRRWAEVLGVADSVVVLPVNYTAPLPVARALPPDWPTTAGLSADLADSRDEAVGLVAQRAREGDIIVTEGVRQDVADIALAILERLGA